MKNLVLYDRINQVFPNIPNVDHFCIDAVENHVYMCSGNIIYRFSQYKENALDTFDLQKEFVSAENVDIVSLNYNSILKVICIATACGDLITVDWVTKSIQIMGTVDKGLRAMEWSPDEEILVLLTGLNTIIIMTLAFDPVTEVACCEDLVGEHQFVNVGWGKKETQFHGSEGKGAAVSRVHQEEKLSEKDDKKPRISWRGDGSMFAVSTVNPKSASRIIQIFSHEGALQYTSEIVPGLEMALSWRPSGNLIASTQILPNKYQVVFYEKNGLRHGEFILPFPPGRGVVCELCWNSQSDVLALYYEDIDETHIQMWSTSNYHWYLKQDIVFPKDKKVYGVRWDTENSLKLHIIISGAEYISLEYIWAVNYSSVNSLNNKGSVAVIDGANILLTNFGERIIPPPMCGIKIQFPASVNQVIFGPFSNSNSLFAVLSDGSLALYNTENQSLQVGKVHWETDYHSVNTQFHHWFWLSNDTLICANTIGLNTQLIVVAFSETDFLKVEDVLDMDDSVLYFAPVGNLSKIVVQVRSKALHMFSLEDKKLTRYQDLPEFYQDIRIFQERDSVFIIGLSASNRLYVNSQEIANNVTSLFMLPKCLLLTTSSHILQFLRLCHSGLSEMGSGRRIENGATIVTALDSQVVLQMPRGNLECITPRPMVLLETVVMLDNCQYYKAFELFRKQRINLNLIIDHDPEKFISNVILFINEVKNANWLSLFLAELSDDDVSSTIYSAYYDQTKPKYTFMSTKVVVICDAVREAMQKTNNPDYYLPILTSYIRKRTDTDLAAALKIVQNPPHGLSRNAGLQHLLFMTDVNSLYNAALGLYDFDLVLMIAAKSNKDPKEYLPFLNELRKLEENYQHYRIDKHLKRYTSALKNIALCSEHFDECLELIKSENLYSKALALFSPNSNEYKQIAELYANYLMSQRLYSEAAVMYERSRNLHEALSACQRAADWQHALYIISQMNSEDIEFQEVCRTLASNLVQQRKYTEAAELLRFHLKDIEEAVAVLCQGHLWNSALHTARDANCLHLIENVIKPGINDHFELLQREITSNKKLFSTYKTRLRNIRTAKEIEPEDKEVDSSIENDMYSDTSSTSFGSSRTSSRSSRSGKNRRKQERKMLSLKEGSQFEDLALIRALHQLFTVCFNLRSEVHNLCYMLLLIGRDIDAANLQQNLCELLDNMERSKTEIWNSDITCPSSIVGKCCEQNTTTTGLVAGITKSKTLLQNFELLEPHLRFPPQVFDQMNWKLSILNT